MSENEQSIHPEDAQGEMTAETETPTEAAHSDAEAGEAAPKTAEDWAAEVAELQGQLDDERLRAAADKQNLIRRHTEEVQSAHKFASQKFAAELLTVKDYLEMALLDQSQNFDALKMGVSMTLDELKKAFEKAHISEIDPAVGDKLDPNRHQAMQAVESEQEANTVVSVMKKGYCLNERVLRPAMVTVAK